MDDLPFALEVHPITNDISFVVAVVESSWHVNFNLVFCFLSFSRKNSCGVFPQFSYFFGILEFLSLNIVMAAFTNKSDNYEPDNFDGWFVEHR